MVHEADAVRRRVDDSAGQPGGGGHAGALTTAGLKASPGMRRTKHAGARAPL